MKFLRIISLALIAITVSLGCANCGQKDDDTPYIRTMPSIERCGDMCDKFVELNCIGYYEDIEIDCSNSAYSGMEQCKDAEGGIAMLDCVGFCEYEMKNSVQLNPGCLADNLAACSEIEQICN